MKRKNKRDSEQNLARARRCIDHRQKTLEQIETEEEGREVSAVEAAGPRSRPSKGPEGPIKIIQLNGQQISLLLPRTEREREREREGGGKASGWTWSSDNFRRLDMFGKKDGSVVGSRENVHGTEEERGGTGWKDGMKMRRKEKSEKKEREKERERERERRKEERKREKEMDRTAFYDLAKFIGRPVGRDVPTSTMRFPESTRRGVTHTRVVLSLFERKATESCLSLSLSFFLSLSFSLASHSHTRFRLILSLLLSRSPSLSATLSPGWPCAPVHL